MDITGSSFGNNATVHQGNVYHNSSDGTSDRCLADLRPTDPRDDKIRLEQTKGGLLRESYSWILENDQFKLWHDDGDAQGRLLWITGDPGKGKTMLICGIIDELASHTRTKNPESKRLLSYFFCQGTDLRINTAVAVLRGLLYLLIVQQPSLISHVKSKYDIAGKSLFEDANAWTALSQILISVLQDASIDGAILVIDALDECQSDQAKLLDFIFQHSSLHRVKWIITSRHGLNIEQRMKDLDSRMLLSLELKENETCISIAVDAYIEFSVKRLDSVRDDEELQDDLDKAMRQKANGTFLWVSLVMKELEHVESWDVLQVVDEIPSDLKQVYARMMKQVLQLERKTPVYCKELLSAVCATYRPLSLAELGFLSDLPKGISEKPGALRRVIAMCGSFLTIRDEKVYLVHQSAKDYLSTEAFETIFPVGIDIYHHSLFSRSLQGMYEALQRDIWGLKAPGVLIDEATAPDPDPLATIRYSCVYWVEHLYDGILDKTQTQINDLEDNGIIHQFLNEKYLYWLEALSLLRDILSGVRALNRLEALIRRAKPKQIIQSTKVIRDARRFILTFRTVIEIAPLQLYASALLFSPTNCSIRCLFSKEEPEWIASKPVMDAQWGPCLQRLEGHEHSISSIACSTDGQRLATGSEDKTVKIWDYFTGACLLTLKGHRDSVTSVVFSTGCQKVVSASEDGTIKIWNARLGNCLHTLKFSSGSGFNSTSLSPNGKLAAEISDERVLTIWNLTDTPSRILSVPATRLSSNAIHYEGFQIGIVLSADNRRFAVHFPEDDAFIWDIATNTLFRTLQGSSRLSHDNMTFSPDGQLLASDIPDGGIKIWNIETGECIKTLACPGIVTSVHVVFSPDGLRIASAFSDGKFMVWDTCTGNHLQTILGPHGWPNSVVFSANGRELISASEGGVARIWDVDTGHTSPVPEIPIHRIDNLLFSKDNKSITSRSDGEIKIWNTSDGTFSHPIQIHPKFYSNDVMFSEGGQWAAVSEKHGTIKISSIDGRQSVQISNAHEKILHQLIFTTNDRYFVSRGDDMVKIWEPTTGECLQIIHDVARWQPIACAPHSQKIATAATFQRGSQLVKIWDITTMECLQTLDTPPVGYMFFSPDDKLLGMAMEGYTGSNRKIKLMKCWDVVKGTCLQTFPDVSRVVKKGAFSSDNQLMVLFSIGIWLDDTRTLDRISVWDVATGASLVSLGVELSIDSLSFDPLNNSHIHTNCGVLDLSLDTPEIGNVSPREVFYRGYGISLDGMWIVNGKERLIWLPPDYRNRATAVLGSQIAIGVVALESNHLCLIKFTDK